MINVDDIISAYLNRCFVCVCFCVNQLFLFLHLMVF